MQSLQDLPDLADRLRRDYDRFSPAQQALARYLVDHMADLPLLSAHEVAAASHCSPATVVRFAQALGFSGYPELQRTVRAAQRPALGAAAAGSGRSTAGGLDTALAADRAQLDEALARVGAHGLAPLVAALSARMPLVIAGEGHARPVVALLEERLLRAGRSVLALEAADPRARVRLAGLGPSAAVLAVALGRETGLAEAAVSAARAAGVPAAVLVDTPLAGLARAPLARVVPADPRDGEPGLVAMVAVAQALAQGLAAGAARALAAVGA